MTRLHPDDEALDAALGELRAALRELRMPDEGTEGETRLLAAWSERQARRRGRAGALLGAALAASVLVVVALVLVVRPTPPLETTADAGAATAAEVAPAVAARRASAGFRPLLYAPPMAPTASYSVVRVRIPVSSLAFTFGMPLDAVVEADVLIGEDGLARAIRFDTADTLLVSVPTP